MDRVAKVKNGTNVERVILPSRVVKIGVNKRTGQSRGYAFVEFESRAEAEIAYKSFQVGFLAPSELTSYRTMKSKAAA